MLKIETLSTVLRNPLASQPSLLGQLKAIERPFISERVYLWDGENKGEEEKDKRKEPKKQYLRLPEAEFWPLYAV